VEFKQFIRTPFQVEALEITEENFEEVAALIGQIRTKDGATFIALDRRIIPNVHRASVGWFVTRLGDNYRCYAPKVFNEQFIECVGTPLTFTFEDAEEEVPAAEYKTSGSELTYDVV
jgi:hypothetical protein